MLLGEIMGSQGGPIGESNETKMTENEAFLAYCQQDDDDDDEDD